MLDHLKNTVADAMRKTALGLLGAVFLVVGLGFLTAAAFIVLSVSKSPEFACLVIGLAYVGLALVLLAFAAARRRPPHRVAHRHPPQDDAPGYDADHPMASVLVAFLRGLQDGAGPPRR